MGPRKKARRDAAEGAGNDKSPAKADEPGPAAKSQGESTSAETKTIAPSTLTARPGDSNLELPSSQTSTSSPTTPRQPKLLQSLTPQATTSTSAVSPNVAALRSDSASIASNDSRQSWYGSWPRAPKSSASTQVARETILGGTLKPASTPDFRRYETQTRRAAETDTSSLNGGMVGNASAQTLPAVREVEQRSPGQKEVKAVASGQPGKDAAIVVSSKEVKEPSPKLDGAKTAQPDPKESSVDNERRKHDAQLSDIKSVPAAAKPASIPQRPLTASSGWAGWFGKTPTTTSEVPVVKDAPPEPDLTPMDVDSAPKGEGQGAAVNSEPQPALKAPAAAVPTIEKEKESAAAAAAAVPVSSWIPFWGASSATPIDATTTQPMPTATKSTAQPKEPEDVVMQDGPPASAPEDPKAPAVTSPSVGSTWAFWSRDTKPKVGSDAQKPGKEEGQIAVIGESSEQKPAKAGAMEISETREGQQVPTKAEPAHPATEESAPKDVSTKGTASKKSKRLRPQSMEIDESNTSRPATPKSDAPKAEAAKLAEAAAKQAATAKASTPTAAKPLPPNILLPHFRSTYSMKENPSILRQIAQLLLRTQSPPAKHVFLATETPKIKKALAIGVHGLFPAAYLRTVIGQPTGTSLKFANHCADAVRKWANAHGCGDCEIEKVALEGEGKIAERVENLWKLLLNWIDPIRKADFIVVGCHSQGVPVAVMLLAKLIELGIITNARIGVCAMAGVSLGPFPDYKSGMGMLMGTAAELWEFSNPDSEVSQRYEQSLRVILSYGVRVTFVGSIDDQLVPMESAVYSPAHHPYIYRAVFIDGRIHAPDFIAHLVGFALKLRNLGVSDHGLIRELSVPLAGSLYSGEGHSRLYDDPQVYNLAVVQALETTDVGNVECEVRRGEWNAGFVTPNPYRLPWTMRGLLEEDFVKTELGVETAELLRQFDDWKPTTKALKDVKYRLEAVRSKM